MGLLFGLQAIVGGDATLFHVALSAFAIGGFLGYSGLPDPWARMSFVVGLIAASASLGLGVYLFASGNAVASGIEATWIEVVIALATLAAMLYEWTRRRHRRDHGGQRQP